MKNYGITIKRHRKGMDKQFYRDTKKSIYFSKLEIKHNINEMMRNKTHIKVFKLNDGRQIYKVIKPDVLKNYIIKKHCNEIDTTCLDVFD